jgi:glutathionylspermidine synthase
MTEITLPASGAYVAADGERAAFQETFRLIHPQYGDACYPPPLFSDAFLAALRADSEALVAIFRSLPERLFGGDAAAWLRHQGLHADDLALPLRFTQAEWMRRAVAFARPDFLVTTTGYKLLEVNFSPAMGGLGNCDQYLERVLGSQFGRRLRDDGLALAGTGMAGAWGRAVRAELRASASSEHPRLFLCVADRSELVDDFRGRAFCEMAERQGFRPKLGWISDLVVGDEGVFHDGERVDVVYSYFVFPELEAHGVPDELIVALAEADARGQVDFFSPPAYVLFDSKSNLELVTDPANAHAFSAAELALIERCVPTCARLTEATRDAVLGAKDAYVIKPVLQSGGRDILIGSSMTDEAWESAVAAALTDCEPWIAQECIADVWTYERREAGLPPSPRSVCLGPLVLGGEAAGILLREMRYDGTPRVINTHQGATFGAAVSALPVAPAAATTRRARS